MAFFVGDVPSPLRDIATQVNRPSCSILTVGVLVLVASAAQATPATTSVSDELPCATDDEVTVTAPRRVLATGLAVFPGFFVNGTGHWVASRPCTARRLLLAEGVGLGGMAVGIPTLAFTGAAHYLAGPAVLLTLGGFGVVLAAFGADIYGVSGASRYAGTPLLHRPSWETELGVLHVYNPNFDFNWLLTQRAAANVGHLNLSMALDTALDGAHARYRLGAGYRIRGPLPGTASRDGSFVDVDAGMSEQRFTGMGFVTDSAEVQIKGRLDLSQFGPTLRGAFAEGTTGIAYSRTTYVGISTDGDDEAMLLGRIGFGAYLGRKDRSGGEAMFYYDHRRDDYAAGVKLPGYGNGIVGHVGIHGRYFVSKQVGIGAVLETGSSHVANLSLLFRSGGHP